MKDNLLIYKASAGSGKTYTLAAYYIARLLGSDRNAHRHVLAVTFTNKAVGEMKERIIQQLYEIAHTDPALPIEDGMLKTVMEMLHTTKSDYLIAKAETCLNDIISDYDHFNVVTIDSFFQSLLSNMEHELGLPMNYGVELGDTYIIDKAVERFIDELPSHPDEMEWTLELIRRRIEQNKAWNISRMLKSFAKNLLNERYLERSEELSALMTDSDILLNYRERLRNERKDIVISCSDKAKALDKYIGDYSDISYGKNRLQPYVKRMCNGEIADVNISNSLLAYLDDEEAWLTTNNKNNEALLTKVIVARKMLCELEAMRAQNINKYNTNGIILKNLNQFRLLVSIGKYLKQITDENNTLLLARTPILFKQLQTGDTTFVFEKIGTRINHIMIDEFQDTSKLQWQNFKQMVDECLSRNKGCLVVGDVKQSIYRWRGGDWETLSNLKHDYGTRANVMPLSKNFRSSSTIVDFNNNFFLHALNSLDPRIKEEIYLTNELVQSWQQKKDMGYVRIVIANENKWPNAIEEDIDTNNPNSSSQPNLDDMAKQITLLHNSGVEWKNMTVLVRKNNETSDIVNYFAAKEYDIPLVSEEAFHFDASPAVQTLIAALRYITDNTDNVSLANVQEKYYLWKARNYDNNLDISTYIESNSLLPDEFYEICKDYKKYTLYELCESLISIFHLNEWKGQDAYLFAFLDEVVSFSTTHAPNVNNLLQEWDNKISQKSISAGVVDGVRIMTIHKAKGLSAHSIFIPYCNWEMEDNMHENILWCAPPSETECPLPLIPISVTSAMKESDFSDIYEEERFRQIVENLNLLYVAFTRAETNLLVWVKGGEKGKATVGKLVSQTLLDEGEITEVPSVITKGELHMEEAKTNNTIEKKHSPLQFTPTNKNVEILSVHQPVKIRQNNASAILQQDENEQKKQTSIERGKLLHHAFALIVTHEDIPYALNTLRNEGLITNLKEEEEMKNFLDNNISNPKVSQWFDGSWKVYNERTILHTSHDGSLSCRPDRTMVKGEQIIVVDYKFGKQSPEHHKQVSHYMKLLSQMGYEKTEGYLWYVFEGKIIKVAV